MFEQRKRMNVLLATVRCRYRFIACFALLYASSVFLRADTNADGPPRALPAGKLPNDRRLGPLKDLDGYFPFSPCATTEEWSTRAKQIRRELAVALGLWPMPEKTPLNAVVHGRIERPDYTVEKVYFESLPGFFVTGNLYRPKGRSGKLPGVLCPHGHWKNGRFMDWGVEEVRKQVASGEEKFEEGGRSVLQSRCVQLARMGCVVFLYDMIGYADSVQFPESLAHGFSKQRPEMNAAENWGLFSPLAEAHLQSVMGLQTWNSIRALDFLTSLPDVDLKRVGVTGASGGGTQTFILCALDERPAVAFPAVMVHSWPCVLRPIGRFERSVHLSELSDMLASGTNRVWSSTECPYCAKSRVVAFDHACYRRDWYACLACEKVWLASRQD